jgi:hypothetical protein
MTPREYLHLVARPNQEAFAADVFDPRLAYNAIATADALAAHIYVWCRINAPSEIIGLHDDNAYRREIRLRDANTGLVHDVAKALKHVELDSKRKVKTASKADPRPAAAFGGDDEVGILVDGEMVQLPRTIKDAIRSYELEMDRLGIL